MSEYISFDPWLKEHDHLRPVPEAAELICSYNIFVEIDTAEESVFIVRGDGSDRFWVKTTAIGIVVEEGMIATAKSAGSEEDAAQTFLDALFRERVGHLWPSEFVSAGILPEATYNKITDRIAKELKGNRKKAKRNLHPIIATAERLKLNPEPAGTGPYNWQARCPETKHWIYISTKSGQFGCGYCRQKGGIAELEKFVADRKAWAARLQA
jgi:hypothetical protein